MQLTCTFLQSLTLHLMQKISLGTHIYLQPVPKVVHTSKLFSHHRLDTDGTNAQMGFVSRTDHKQSILMNQDLLKARPTKRVGLCQKATHQCQNQSCALRWIRIFFPHCHPSTAPLHSPLLSQWGRESADPRTNTGLSQIPSAHAYTCSA